MTRPRESGGRRLLSNAIALAAPAAISWAHDVAGNAVQAAVLQCPTEILVVESVSRVEPSAAAHPVFAVAASAITFLFRYTDDAWMDLGEPDGPPIPGRLAQPTGLGRAVRRGLCDRYFIPAQRPERRGRRRHRVSGPGRPKHAIPERDPDIGDGLMRRPRDLARRSRALPRLQGPVVSRYLHDPSRMLLGSAVARDLRLAMPLVGSFVGPADAFLDMSIQFGVGA